ncbi:MAG: glycosyltransferase family 2 protein [Candidatus Methanofastidiosia archaeon]
MGIVAFAYCYSFLLFLNTIPWQHPRQLAELVYYYNYVALFYLLTVGTIYFILNIVSFIVIKKYVHEIEHIELAALFHYGNAKPVSIIVPAYNESNTIIDSTHAFLQLEYPDFHVIVVNDGSKDDTLDNLITHFSMENVPYSTVENLTTKPVRGVYMSRKYPSLLVVNKENGGKGDALNAGINVSKDPLICVIDADSILERDCILKIVRPFVKDENTIAVGGIIRIANGCQVKEGRILKVGLPKTWLGKFQVVEYLRAFLFGRTGFDYINAMLIISGAFGCFSREALLEVGGYATNSVGEDMELVVRMHKKIRQNNPDAHITFIPDPVCWTEAPETLRGLRSQRMRWQKGTVQTLMWHKNLFFNPEYRGIGLFAFPYYVIFEMLGPLVEFGGYIVFIISWLLGLVSVPFAIAFLAVAILYGMALSISSVVLEELSFRKYPKTSHIIHLFLAALLENIGYRQLQTWWRVRGMLEYLFGARGWGKLKKMGFGAS